MLQPLRTWARNLKNDLVALWLAARDPRVPWYAKAMAGMVAALRQERQRPSSHPV